MKLDRITLLRPNMGDYRSTDGLPPLSMAVLAARTPKHIGVTFYDDKVEVIPESDVPDLVAITVETFTARRSYELARRYRENPAKVEEQIAGFAKQSRVTFTLRPTSVFERLSGQ